RRDRPRRARPGRPLRRRRPRPRDRRGPARGHGPRGPGPSLPGYGPPLCRRVEPRPAPSGHGPPRCEGSASRERRRHRDLSIPAARPISARDGRAPGRDTRPRPRSRERESQEPGTPRAPRPRGGHRGHGRREPGGGVMALRIFNSLSRKKEDFTPLRAGEARIYVCGVTVYDLSHIGHARSAIVFDVVNRYLRFKGLRVTFVKNFTDVDDKIIKRANDEGLPATGVSERYIAVLPPDVEPKATEHIPEMVDLVQRLIVNGVAYVVDGDVYFEVRRFPDYGALSGKNIEDLEAGARVDVDERKRDPLDFALWKAAKPDEPSWPSPWGP